MRKLKAIYATFVMGIGLAIIMFFIFLTKHKNNALKARRACKIWFPLCGFELERIGEFDRSATLIIMNHQSLTDIMCLEAYHPQNICWVAKKQLGEIPFYGYALRGPEMILIDREDKKGLAFLLKSVKEKLSQNRPIAIFPEGTRSKGLEDFLPFKPGAKILAEKFQLKIQPILFVHTKKLYNTSPLETQTSRARVVCLEAFEPDYQNHANWYEELKSQMHATYLEHYHQMNAAMHTKA
ncbi:1-acylglycerol-3-phosphate O-acyltransferase [Helicobacter mustelae]|uniref:1-acyl-sn-glycerol-3-phosphate acyltransferase n=1 Tax=Helicobacter mustelae (strain ATCC 43772 / CCUG 25715 / CIP 103759 / LMG 18044 / NCTC 12198 / R85-136P) TaxID=679897 RepID=D3UI76_HELM1|nr:1-acylglycerol-3-phosphate O-acyltransferase [Helicobacter mustelae]CBG40199.1 putative 1-acyl-SN-glycerol-3-phosphate acyltransferase [Helicobacter mustelae 12198]SQH71701.1 1-acyl-SN-glycerol-3-phosphate acyltransferase [Helicobacter mustelae]STP12827.1 1-acyl-SN-glycerol-3-phosphate acyltransferase [Helicobacter mustelae]